MALTPKQENFCLAYLETSNASEAYRQVYDCEGSSATTVNRTAKELLDNPKIAARLAELRAPIIAKAQLTVEDLLAELEEARRLAIDTEAPAPAVSATMGKAKLLGLDKQVIEHTGPNGGPILTRDVSEMTDAELAALIDNDNQG